MVWVHSDAVYQCPFHLSIRSSVNNPGYKISIFVVPGTHKVPNVHRMSVQRIHTILTIQSKGDLLDPLSPIPEQKFLFVVISIFPVDTGDWPGHGQPVLRTLDLSNHFPKDPNKERYFDQPIFKKALRSLLNFETDLKTNFKNSGKGYFLYEWFWWKESTLAGFKRLMKLNSHQMRASYTPVDR